MKRMPEEYRTLPLELFSVSDLTDALGIEASAQLLGTSKRSVYTVRNTNSIGEARTRLLIGAIKQDEENCRTRLIIRRIAKQIRNSKE